MMLDAVALKHRDFAAVEMDRTRDRYRPFRIEKAIALTVWEIQTVSNTIELGPRHLKDGTGIDVCHFENLVDISYAAGGLGWVKGQGLASDPSKVPNC